MWKCFPWKEGISYFLLSISSAWVKKVDSFLLPTPISIYNIYYNLSFKFFKYHLFKKYSLFFKLEKHSLSFKLVNINIFIFISHYIINSANESFFSQYFLYPLIFYSIKFSTKIPPKFRKNRIYVTIVTKCMNLSYIIWLIEIIFVPE